MLRSPPNGEANAGKLKSGCPDDTGKLVKATLEDQQSVSWWIRLQGILTRLGEGLAIIDLLVWFHGCCRNC